MKTIFVPVDFSEAATHAARYAYVFAKKTGAEIILYHTYHLPVSTAEVPMFVIPQVELEETSMQQLRACREELIHGDKNPVQISCRTSAGFAVDEIRELVESIKPDLIVMGVSGAGKIRHAIWGTVATGVMKHISVPMIVVPEKAKLEFPQQIGFACDYKADPCSKALKQLKEFVSLCEADLHVINVERPAQELSLEKAESTLRFETELSGIRHSLHFPVNTNVTEALLEFEDNNPIDLLAMIPHEHSLLERLFLTSRTETMIFESRIPLLIIKN